jgi:beta-galactosidase
VFGAGRELIQEPPLPVFQKLESVQAKYAAPLHSEMDSLCHKGWQQTPGGPRSAEAYGHSLGLMAYRYQSAMDLSNKNIEGKASDRAHMWVNGKFLQHFAGSTKNVALKQKVPETQKVNGTSTLDVVVDTMGRANFGMERKQMHDTRGLWEARLDGKGMNSGADGQWSVCNLRLDDASALGKVAAKRNLKSTNSGPSFFSATLDVADATKDTFLHPGEGWQRGIAFINGFNLGRYDMTSAQKDLYVPASVLKEGSNEILMLETGENALRSDKIGSIDFIETRITKT